MRRSFPGVMNSGSATHQMRASAASRCAQDILWYVPRTSSSSSGDRLFQWQRIGVGIASSATANALSAPAKSPWTWSDSPSSASHHHFVARQARATETADVSWPSTK